MQPLQTWTGLPDPEPDFNMHVLSSISYFPKSGRVRIMDGDSDWHRPIVKIWKEALDIIMADTRQ